MLGLSNRFLFSVFDNPLEQGRCQIYLIFGKESHNLLNLITKNLFSILRRIDFRDPLSVSVDRNYPGWIVEPGKNDPVAFGKR